LLWFYETVYSDLCSQTHNRLDSIEHRHIEQKTKDKISIKYLQLYNIEDFYKYILTLLIYFNEAIGVVNRTLDLKCDILVEEIQEKIRGIV